MVAELCDPVVEDVEGALEMEVEEGEEGEEALGVTAGAFEMDGEEEEEEGEDTLGVGAVAVDGVLGVTAGVTAGAAVTDELGVPVVYVTFFTTFMYSLAK